MQKHKRACQWRVTNYSWRTIRKLAAKPHFLSSSVIPHKCLIGPDFPLPFSAGKKWQAPAKILSQFRGGVKKHTALEKKAHMHKHVQSKSSKTDVTAPQSNKVLGIQNECMCILYLYRDSKILAFNCITSNNMLPLQMIRSSTRSHLCSLLTFKRQRSHHCHA